MKLKNIELLLKSAKGIPCQIKERNRTVDKITSFGYQIVTAETADRIFAALSNALEERTLLRKLNEDLGQAFRELSEEERQIINLMSRKEMTLREASAQFDRPDNEIRAGYRRAMRKMSKALVLSGYVESDVEMFVGTGGMLTAG